MKLSFKRIGSMALAAIMLTLTLAGTALADFGNFGFGSSSGFGTSVNTGNSGFGFGNNNSEQQKPEKEQDTKVYGVIYNVSSFVNFRSAASAKADKVPGCSTLKKGANVTILATEGNWYQVQFGSYVGYVDQKYVKVQQSATNPPEASGNANAVIANVSSFVNFRSAASSKASKVAGCNTLKKGAAVTVLAAEGNWYKLQYGSYVGYVDQKYVEMTAAMPDPTPDNGDNNSNSNNSSSDNGFGFGNGFGNGSGNNNNGFGGGNSSGNGFGSGSTTTPPSGNTGNSAPSGSNTKAILSSSDQATLGKMSSNYASARKTNNDVNGWIFVPGTNVNYPILFSSSFYYNDHNINGKKETRGCIYSYTSAMHPSKMTTISGHNSRTSGTMFHELHHWQDALKKNKNGNRIAFIQFAGTQYTQWEVFAMYETKNTNAAKTVMRTNILQHTVNNNAGISGASKQAWIDSQIAQSEVKFGTTASSGDTIIVLMTCGDNYASTSYARLYFFLKGVA